MPIDEIEAPEGTPKVYVFVLCGYERHHWICPELADFLYMLPYASNVATHYSKAHNFIPASSARNFIGKQSSLIEPAPDWLLMIDNDQGPPLNIFECIKDAPKDAAVIVPRFHLWSGTKSGVTLCWGMAPEDEAKFVNNGVGVKIEKKFYPLTKCGTGCIFIKPEVFKKISEPWFEYKHDSLGSMTATEDIIFCEKVIAAGMKIYGYGGCTVGHYHTIDIALINQIITEQRIKLSELSAENDKLKAEQCLTV